MAALSLYQPHDPEAIIAAANEAADFLAPKPRHATVFTPALLASTLKRRWKSRTFTGWRYEIRAVISDIALPYFAEALGALDLCEGGQILADTAIVESKPRGQSVWIRVDALTIDPPRPAPARAERPRVPSAHSTLAEGAA